MITQDQHFIQCQLLRKIVEQPISICPPPLDKGRGSLAEERGAKTLFKVSFPLSFLCLIGAVISLYRESLWTAHCGTKGLNRCYGSGAMPIPDIIASITAAAITEPI
jgi:hypothetical protein